MNEQMKSALDSYLRNLLGVVLALVVATMESTGITSPLDFGPGEWLALANGVWAAAIPTLIRYFNKKDPAFGLVAETLAKGVTEKLETAAKAAPKAAVKAPAKAPAKKPAAKKPAGGSSASSNQAQ